MESFLPLAALYIVFLFSATFHEAAHAWVALRGGDRTAYEGGQVSLDPRPHIAREPFGMVILPILFLVIAGWPLGYASAPYNVRWAERYPHRAAKMALAGPLSNLLLVVVAAILIRVGMGAGIFIEPTRIGFSAMAQGASSGWPTTAALLVSLFFSMNLLLFTLNLIPLPPLDGSAAIGLLLDENTARKVQNFLRQPMFAMVGMLIAWRLFEFIFWPALILAARLIYPGAIYG